MKVVLCDVDEVVAGLLPEWVRRYNAMWKDNLQLADIHGWDLTQYVKPECGARIYEFLNDPDLYSSVLPVPGARVGIARLRKKYRVVFVTSSNAASATPKLRWLYEWGLIPSLKAERDVIVAHDKALIRGDVLVDDGAHNIEAFPGPTVLVDQPHNRGLDHPRRARSWDEIVAHVDALLSAN